MKKVTRDEVTKHLFRGKLEFYILFAFFFVFFCVVVSVVLWATGFFPQMPFVLTLVLLTLCLFACTIVLITNNKRFVYSVCFVDSVTGMENWTRFSQTVQQKLAEAKPGTYAYIVADIDKFRMLNEIFGVQSCTRVLKILSEVIRENIASDECAARINTDVFALLVKNMPEKELLARVKTLNERILALVTENSQVFTLSVSWGLYVVNETGIPLSILNDRTLMAMRTKKEHFGCTFAFYSDRMRETAVLQSRIENSMQSALANGEFQVYLQPKYSLKSNTLCGAEALVRWKSEKYGFLMPDTFIPLFEQNGFVNRIDLYIFEQICLMLNQQIKNGIQVIPISFNLSRLHLLDPEIVDKLSMVRDLYRVPLDLIEVELTESAFYANQELLIHTMDRMHESGFKIAVDDFGSGYSSLNMLSHIPLDTLKIDRSFITGSVDSEKGKIILADVIGMARDLGLQIVCEGVETQQQLQFVKMCSCDVVQGFLFGKPMPMSDFEQLMRQEQSGIR